LIVRLKVYFAWQTTSNTVRAIQNRANDCADKWRARNRPSVFIGRLGAAFRDVTLELLQGLVTSGSFEEERAQILVPASIDRVFVVVLVGEIPPDNTSDRALDHETDDSAPEVAALRRPRRATQ